MNPFIAPPLPAISRQTPRRRNRWERYRSRGCSYRLTWLVDGAGLIAPDRGDRRRHPRAALALLHAEVGAIPSWEDGIGERPRGPSIIFRAVLLDGPAILIFAGASVLAQWLIAERDPSFAGVDHTAWVVNLAVTAVAVVAPIWTGIRIRKNSEKARIDARRARDA